MGRSTGLAVVGLAAVGIGMLSLAGTPADDPAEPAAAEVRISGVRVAVDPETGRLVAPTPEQVRLLTAALRAELGQTAEPRSTTVRPDGTRLRPLDLTQFHFTIAERTAEGELTTSCVDLNADTTTDGVQPAAKTSPGER